MSCKWPPGPVFKSYSKFNLVFPFFYARPH